MAAFRLTRSRILDALEGLVDGAIFATRLRHPLIDGLLSPPGQSAGEQLARTVIGVQDYVGKGVAEPQKVMRDIGNKVRELHLGVDPAMTPVAPTTREEFGRRFEIGMNQGELAFDVGSFIVGGPLATKVRFAVPPSAAEKFVTQGFSPRVAEYLAEPYQGMGHHYVPRRFGLPPSYSDSVFNVLKPPEISIGDFYELHYQVDRHFHGAPIPPRLGGERSWSGGRLGLEKYGSAGRLLHGAPGPLKARIGGLGAGAGGALHDVQEAAQ